MLILRMNLLSVIGMRRLLILFVFFILAAFLVDTLCPGIDDRPPEARFEEHLNRAHLLTYNNNDFDFSVQYPSFFTVQPDSLIDYAGCVQFCYREDWANIVLEYHVAKPIEGVSARAYAKHVAERKKADKLCLYANSFIISGRLYEGYRYHEKHMLKDTLWHVYALYYPENYQNHVTRLFRMIDRWQVKIAEKTPIKSLCCKKLTD